MVVNRLLSSFEKRDGFLPGVVFIGLIGCDDHFHNCLEHLVMAPVIAAIGQGIGIAAEEMLKGPSPNIEGRKEFHSCPMCELSFSKCTYK